MALRRGFSNKGAYGSAPYGANSYGGASTAPAVTSTPAAEGKGPYAGRAYVGRATYAPVLPPLGSKGGSHAGRTYAGRTHAGGLIGLKYVILQLAGCQPSYTPGYPTTTGGWPTVRVSHRTYSGRTYAGRLPTMVATSGVTVSMAGTATSEAAGSPSPPAQGPNLRGAVSSGAVGQPILVFNQAATMQGGTSAFAAGPVHTGQTFPMLGVTSSEAEGVVSYIQALYIAPLGATTGFVGGLYSTSVTVPMRGATTGQGFGQYRVNVTIPMQGAATAEQVATPIVAQSVPIRSVAPSFAAGLFSTSVTLPMAGFTDEQFGRPPPPAQTTRPLLAAPSSESAGQPIVGDFKLIGSALSAEGAGQPKVLPGPVYVNMLGEVLTAVGRPSISVTAKMVGVQSAEGVSQFLPIRAQHHDIQGLASGETFGQPTIPIKPVAAPTGAAFGQPLVSVSRVVAMQGAASAETPGGPYVGSIVAMVGIPSSEAVSLPLVPIGIPTGFAGGQFTFSVPAQNQTLTPAGAASLETFGVFHPITATIAPAGVLSSAQVAQPFVARQLRMVGIATSEAVSPAHVRTALVLIWPVTPDEAVGLPSFPSPQAVHMGGAASAEMFGAPGWTFGIVVYPIGAATGENIGRVTFAFGGITRTMQGKASDGIVSPAHFAQTAAIGSIATAEAVGLPVTPQSLSPRGVTSAEAVGRPARPIAGATVATMQGAASAAQVGQPLLPITLAGAASSVGLGTPTVVHSATIQGAGPSSAFGQPSILQTVYVAGASSAETPGQPSTVIFVPVLGTESGEAFGGLTLHTTLDVAMGGADTAAELGQPALELFNQLSPTAVDPAEEAGRPAISQGVNPAGADSGEAFGQPTSYATLTVRLGSAVSLEAEGIARVALVTYIRPAAAPDAAAVGNPKIHRTVPLASANTSEAFGQPQAQPGEVRLHPWGITEYPFEPHTPHDKYGEPLVTTWVLGGRPLGVPSAETLGRPRQLAQGTHPAGVASAEQPGRPVAPGQIVHLAGAASVEQVGRFWGNAVAFAAPTGVATTEAWGRPRTPSQAVRLVGVPAGQVGQPKANVLERAQGAASSGGLGRPTVVQYLRPSSTGPSSEAFGLPSQLAQGFLVASAMPAELVSRFSTGITVPIAPAGVGEQTGESSVVAVYVVCAGPAAPGEQLGGPSISTVVHVGLVGSPSLETVGQPSWRSLALLALVGTADDEAVGGVGYSVYPSTGAWIDTSVSGIAQMLDANGRSLSVSVLAISQGMSLSDSTSSGPPLLGETLPLGTQPVSINPGDGIGVRYIGQSDLIPESLVFLIDGNPVDHAALFFWHEDTQTLGAPWTDLDIYWLSPTNHPPGSHTASVTVSDVAGHTATLVWEFNVLVGVPGGPT